MKSVWEQILVLVMLGSEFYKYDGFLQEIVHLFLKISVYNIINSIQNVQNLLILWFHGRN